MPLLLLLGAVLGALNLGQSLVAAGHEALLDVGVFRDAGAAFINGDPLYQGFPSRSGFAFIYPPFAALLFVPLTWVNELTMDIMWNTSIIGAVFLIMAMAAHRLGLRPWWAWAAALTGFSTCLDTISSNLYYGQINIFLILLVTADVLGFTPKPIRGIGIGVAAGIKLTPAAFGVLFLVRKDWWSVARSAGFFVLTAIIGFIFRPQESIYFWTEEFFATDRGGDIFYPPNQGIGGMLSRGLVDAGVVEKLAPVILLLFAAATIFIAYRLEQRGRSVEALLIVVLGISLGGPFAVSHHWAGIILVLPLIFTVREQALRFLLAVAAGAWIVPGYELVNESRAQEFVWPLWFNANIIGLMGLAIFIAYLIFSFGGRFGMPDLGKDPQDDCSSDTDHRADPGASQRTTSPAPVEVDAEHARPGELNA